MQRQIGMGGMPLAVFPVADNRMPLFSEVYPDLMLSAGQQVNLQQAEPFMFFQESIGRLRQLALGRVGGGIDHESGVLGQIAADGPLGRADVAKHHGQIDFGGVVPIRLQEKLGLFAFGKEQDSGGVTVQPVYDVHPIAGLGVALADVVIEDRVHGPGFVPLGAHGQ